MKITIEIDLTPAEFRESMGWPDVSEFQNQLMDDIREKMQAGVEGYDPMSLMRPFLMQSASTMEGFQKAMAGMMGSVFSAGNPSSDAKSGKDAGKK